MSLEAKKQVLVSIDWGTYGVFVLYAHVGYCTNPRLVLLPDGSQNVGYAKIPNSLLISRDTGEIIKYGGNALRTYADYQQALKETPSEEAESVLYQTALFENFKLHLLEQKENDFDRHLLIPSADPNFAYELGFLVEKWFDVIKRSTIDHYKSVEDREKRESLNTETEILWIISVPASWTDLAKETIIQCCVGVGMNSDDVLIVSEPEAAASYFLSDTDEGEALSQGDEYMSIDLGSETFNVVCHKVLCDKIVMEIHREGGLAGGRHVDDKFFILLGHVFSEECVAKFIEECPAYYIAQRVAFQRLRESLPEDVAAPLSLDIEENLFEIATDINLTMENVEENCANFHPDGFPDEQLVSFKRLKRGRFTRYMLRIHPIGWQWLFHDVLTKVKTCVKRVLAHQDCEGIRTIFASGGFSRSAIVQAELRKLLSDDEDLRTREITWKRPFRPELVVAQGLLWFAENVLQVGGQSSNRKEKNSHAVQE